MRRVLPENIDEIEALSSNVDSSISDIKAHINKLKDEASVMMAENTRIRNIAYGMTAVEMLGVYRIPESLVGMTCLGYGYDDYGCAASYIHNVYMMTDGAGRSFSALTKTLDEKEKELSDIKMECASQIKKLEA
jgi:uncharacterized protein YukE